MHAEHCLRSVLSLSPLLLVILAESGPLSDHLLSRVNNPHSPNLPELLRETSKRVDLFSNKAQHLQFSSTCQAEWDFSSSTFGAVGIHCALYEMTVFGY